MGKSRKYKCIDCDSEFECQLSLLNRRKYRAGEKLCKKCYKNISSGGRYGHDYYPEELRKYLKDDYFEYSVIKKYIKTLRTKKKVRFDCQECGFEEIMEIAMMHRRKICGVLPICRKCSLGFAVKTEEWISNNSKAQIIAQNRPEVLEKQREAQCRLMESDPLYADKRCSHSYVSGKIDGFRFDSSWELYFIAYCWESDDIASIDRYVGSIPYEDKDGISRKYYPDFIVKYNSGKSKIIEIKGSKKYNNFHEKFNAARKIYGMGYLVYEEKDLKRMGIHFGRESYLREFYKKYNGRIVFYNNSKIDKLKDRIREWLK
jgi:hypothetical protein